MRRPRVSLRTRIAATIALVVVAATLVVTFAAYELERSGTEARFVAAARTGATSDLQQATASLDGQPAGRDQRLVAQYLAQRSGIDWIVLADGAPDLADNVTAADVPTRIAGADQPGTIVTAWASVGGVRMLAVAGSVTPSVRLVEFYDFSPVQQQLARLRVDLIRLGVLALLVAVLIGIVLATRVTRPVREAADAARQLGDGDLDTRIPEHRHDELGDLATAFNQMAQRLSETLRELQTAQTQQRRFVADVSHELRTPLAAMLAAGETLGHPDPALRARAGALLAEQTRRLSALVEELLEISRFDAGQAALELEDVDLEQVVADAIRTVAPDRDVRLTHRGETTVRCDPRRVHTIVRNLTGNAVQHGGEPVDVLVDGRPDAVTVTVADSGPGIDPTLVPVIFDRFVRADTARGTDPRTGGSGSTGLGLAIAYENAQLHGATLTLRTEGRTTFVLTLPRTLRASRPEPTR